MAKARLNLMGQSAYVELVSVLTKIIIIMNSELQKESNYLLNNCTGKIFIYIHLNINYLKGICNT